LGRDMTRFTYLHYVTLATRPAQSGIGIFEKIVLLMRLSFKVLKLRFQGTKA